MKPNIKLYLTKDCIQNVFGSGKWHLLVAIQQYGSIQNAAKSLGRSYRKAWGDIKQAEIGLGKKLIVTSRGGKSGGEAKLTDFGSELLLKWNDYYTAIESSMKQAYAIHLSWIDRVISDKEELL